MRARLARAAIDSLIERGYARTSPVEVCARAGVTRGAFHHHFPSLAALYAESLRGLYAELTRAIVVQTAATTKLSPLVQLVHHTFASTRRREFKAVIEIWLAARNDEALRDELVPLIEQLSGIFSPVHNPRLAQRLGTSRKAAAFYRLVMEAMIGLALGRAVAAGGRAVAHEKVVVDLLLELAAGYDRAP